MFVEKKPQICFKSLFFSNVVLSLLLVYLKWVLVEFCVSDYLLRYTDFDIIISC